jgi:hypothetical protein
MYAAYNPFFSEEKAPQPPKETFPIDYMKPPSSSSMSERRSIEMTYFGFVESAKGTFALVNFNSKNIIIRQKDSLYIDEEIYTIEEITSNYITLKDKSSRTQTVYFSSERQRQKI